MSVKWDYCDKFDKINETYLPVMGEGDTKATQIVTAINKLVYKWYNDGDVFDNTYYLSGWANDLSSYANWLDKYTDAGDILCNISNCTSEDEYEDLLQELADVYLDEDYLAEEDANEKIGTIYDCDGRFRFEENYDEY